MYYINALKRELVDTHAYKLQPSLSERVIDDGHGCHTALHFGVKAKENQDKVYERSGKNLFCPLKNSGEILDKLKAIDFNATSLSTYDFSTLYTTLPHNLI